MKQRKLAKEDKHLWRRSHVIRSALFTLAYSLTMYRTERNRAQSPLLRLPGEIRNQIYRQLIEDDWDPYWLTSRNKIFRRGSNLE